MNNLKAIETEYKGYRFRSRLEARWAVFLDAIDEPWHYEHEGFDLKCGYYLPDFWMPRMGCFFEVKGAFPNKDELAKAACLCQESQRNVWFLQDIPWIDQVLDIVGFYFFNDRSGCGFQRAAFIRCQSCQNSHLVLPASSNFNPRFEDGIVDDEDCPKCGRDHEPYKFSDFENEGWFEDLRAKSFYFEFASRMARAARFEHGEAPA